MTGVDEALDEVDLVGDVAGGARLVGGGLHAEGLVRLREFALEAVGPGPPVPAGFGGLGEDLVVDVGDVADVGDLVAAAAQPADQRVEGHGGAQVADVRGALHGGAAQVDADLAGGDRVEGLDAGALGVVQVQHGTNPTWQGGEAKETGAPWEHVTRPGPRPAKRHGFAGGGSGLVERKKTQVPGRTRSRMSALRSSTELARGVTRSSRPSMPAKRSGTGGRCPVA